jgi:hypothetical protein
MRISISLLLIVLLVSCTQTKNNNRSSKSLLYNNIQVEQPVIIGGYKTIYSLPHDISTRDISITIGEGFSDDFYGLEQMVNTEFLYIRILKESKDIDFFPLRSLTNIKTIIIEGRELVEVTNIGEIPTLESLEIKYSKLRNLNGIEKLTSLKYLVLSRNKNKMTDTSALRYLKNLESITFDNGYYNIDFSVLGELPKLYELSIEACVGVNLIDINQLISLRKLSLGSNVSKEISEYITYQHLQEIGNMDRLLELFIDEAITSVEFISGCVSLERLVLIADQEREDFWINNLPLDVSPLKNLVNLKYLALYGFELINEELLEALPKLEEIETELYPSR